MYRLPCAIEFIRGKPTLTYIVTLSRADLPQFLSFVEKIKDGSYKGVELAGKDGKVCHVRCEGGLLVFGMESVTLRLDEIQDECLVSFLTDMTADAPQYDHVDFEFRDTAVDLAVRVER